MGNNNITNNDYSKVKLSEKDKLVEWMSVALCALMLVACFLKVMFF